MNLIIFVVTRIISVAAFLVCGVGLTIAAVRNLDSPLSVAVLLPLGILLAVRGVFVARATPALYRRTRTIVAPPEDS